MVLLDIGAKILLGKTLYRRSYVAHGSSFKESFLSPLPPLAVSHTFFKQKHYGKFIYRMTTKFIYDNRKYYSLYRECLYSVNENSHLFITVLISISVLDYKYNSKHFRYQ